MRNTVKTLVVLALSVSLLTNCETLSKYKGTIGGGLVGCLVGLGLGAAYDDAMNKKASKKKSDPKTMVSEWFKKKKSSNKGKIVGLAAGCATGLGIGFYLDTMADDMESRLKEDGITMERIKDANGETKEIYLNMGENAIEFQSDKADYKDAAGSNRIVQRLAEAFKAYPDTQIKISGHVSAAKKDAANTKLSQQRADAVKNGLINNGMSSGQVFESVGKSNEAPLPGTKTTDARN
ncbi:MAG: OmpA family protein, partial [Leptospiraceae bacterium]|nr:OmpA family protein [Leptospiraceae bacterium]